MRPEYLKSGDSVALVATAKRINEGELNGAIELMESWGLRVVLGSNLYATDNQFAGTDLQRAADLQWALDSEEFKAVIFARGGYGTARIIDAIDWSKFEASPKWLCGFSDLTVLHAHVQRQLSIETLHSSMPIFFKDSQSNEGSDALRACLFGTMNDMVWSSHVLNRQGSAEGTIVGGNLSVICSILGSASQSDFTGKILVLEDLCENLYHLDRMMVQLRRAGVLSNLAGMIVGQFTDMEDNEISFGKDADEIIKDAVKEFDYPVAFDAPVGHVADNMAFRHGAAVRIEIANSTKLTYLN